MRNVYESLNKASISKYLLNKAMLYSLALLFIAAQGCSSGSDAVDKFLGDAEVPDPEVTYSLDLDPAVVSAGVGEPMIVPMTSTYPSLKPNAL